jgi:hypothetical protein
MGSVRKASLRELASAAYELDADVVQGKLHQGPDGGWMIGEASLDSLLRASADKEIYLIVASLEDDRPMPVKVCRTCGTEYSGLECPHCRLVRSRLRGG